MTNSDTVNIIVNNKPVHLTGTSHTGAQIKAAAGVGPTYELFLTHEPGEKKADEQIPNDAAIELRNGMKFRAIPPGNQG